MKNNDMFQSMFNPFAPTACQLIYQALDDARLVYAECHPVLDEARLRFAIGNAADYGGFKAQAATGTTLSTIFIPTSNQFSPLELTDAGFDIKPSKTPALHGL